MRVTGRGKNSFYLLEQMPKEISAFALDLMRDMRGFSADSEGTMNPKVKWGVIGVADIAVKKVIPAMQRGEWSEVVGIASRDVERAKHAAEQLGIRKAYGSYEELLADPDIEAIYNPLPPYGLEPKPCAQAGPTKVLASADLVLHAERSFL